MSRHVRASITFDGTANNGQAGSNVTVFTITGRVRLIDISVFCTANLTEGGATATVSLGVTGNTAALIAATNSVDIDANEWWGDTAPDTGIGTAILSAPRPISADVVIACATQDTDGGTLVVDAEWEPITDDGNLA